MRRQRRLDYRSAGDDEPEEGRGFFRGVTWSHAVWMIVVEIGGAAVVLYLWLYGFKCR